MSSQVLFLDGTEELLANRFGHTHLRAMKMTALGSVPFDTRSPGSRAQRFARIEALGTLLDVAFVVPGTRIRFGIDALIGLVPGIGDIVTTALSLYIVSEVYSLGAPRHLIARLLANVALDGAIGAVPLIGDAFDVVWRANRRNIALLRDWLRVEDSEFRMRK
jgi:hypothetical protein